MHKERVPTRKPSRLKKRSQTTVTVPIDLSHLTTDNPIHETRDPGHVKKEDSRHQLGHKVAQVDVSGSLASACCTIGKNINKRFSQ